jgi:WD40 repeat protein
MGRSIGDMLIALVFAVCFALLGGRDVASAAETPAALAKPMVRTDLYGDPLPPGAVARIGSLRLLIPNGCREMAFTHDGKQVATLDREGVIDFWDVDDGRKIRTLKADGLKFTHFLLSPDGKVLAGAVGDTLALFNAASLEEMRRIAVKEMDITCLAFSPDGKLLAAGCKEKLVRLWEVDSGKEKAKLEGHEHRILSVEFSPDGRSLAVDDFDYPDPDNPTARPWGFRMWDVAAGKTRWKDGPEPANSILEFHFLPDGKAVEWCCPSYNGEVRVVDAADNKVLRVIDLGPNYVTSH